MKTFGIVGAGGFGRETMPVALQGLSAQIKAGQAELCFVVEGQVSERLVNGFPVMTSDEFCGLEGERFFNIAIGDSSVRERISTSLISRDCSAFPVVAPNAVLLDANQIGEGAILCPFTIVTSNAIIGRFFHANIYSYVAHDCKIGDFVTFAPGVKCNGRVVIEDHAYVGTGAMLREGTTAKPLVIGHHAVIGMGAVVTKSVAPGCTVVGNPARIMEKR